MSVLQDFEEVYNAITWEMNVSHTINYDKSRNDIPAGDSKMLEAERTPSIMTTPIHIYDGAAAAAAAAAFGDKLSPRFHPESAESNGTRIKLRNKVRIRFSLCYQ